MALPAPLLRRPGGSVPGAELTGSRSRSGLGRGHARGEGSARRLRLAGWKRRLPAQAARLRRRRSREAALPPAGRGRAAARGRGGHRRRRARSPRVPALLGPPPPRISPAGLERQRGKPPLSETPVLSVSQGAKLLGTAADSPAACPPNAQLPRGLRGGRTRKHWNGNPRACLLFALHFEMNAIPNAPAPEKDDLPSLPPPFSTLHRCSEA